MRKFVRHVLVVALTAASGCVFHDKHACVYLLTESYDIDFSSGSGVEKVSRCLEGHKTHSKHWVGLPSAVKTNVTPSIHMASCGRRFPSYCCQGEMTESACY